MSIFSCSCSSWHFLGHYYWKAAATDETDLQITIETELYSLVMSSVLMGIADCTGTNSVYGDSFPLVMERTSCFEVEKLG